MKLAVFSGQYFWFDGNRYSTDEAFVKFVNSFYPYFEKIIFCDVVITKGETKAYILDPTKTEVCPLPYFSVYSFWRNILVIYPKIYQIIKDNIHHWDVVWLHTPHPVSLIFARICRKTNKPFFLFIRQNLRTQVGYRNKGLRRILAVWVAAMLQYVFRLLSRHTLTFTVGKEVFDIYRRNSKRVYQATVSLVSEKDITLTVPKRVPDSPGQIRLLSVGRLDPEKGLIYLIRAMDRLIANGRRDIVLELVGRGSEEERLRREINKRGLAQYIHFLGYVGDSHQLLNLYKESDIFVLPSLSEGLPQVLFEAMACGLPIVASRTGGIPQLINDGENGLLINPVSAQEIVEAVELLTSNPELRNQLAINGLTTVRNHTLEAERDRMVIHIRGLTGGALGCDG